MLKSDRKLKEYLHRSRTVDTVKVVIMKRHFSSIGVFFFIALLGILYILKPFMSGRPIVPVISPTPVLQQSTSMKLQSPVFADHENIPKEYTCDGHLSNPPLTISDVPKNAKSIVLIVDDPDAPLGTFTHWLLWNIDPATTNISSGVTPHLAQVGTNSAGREGWTGPCPPNGTHRYFFTLYALDTTIGLDGKSKKSDIDSAMNGHVLDRFQLVGVYARN